MRDMLYPLIAISRLRITTDGDGITTLVAGSGCPLSCAYCINSDVLTKKPNMVTPKELYNRVKIDDLYFCATGGGITFGGGESLLHAEFIHEFRKLCGNKWNIYVETSLNVDTELVKLAAMCVDSFIVDIKTFDPKIYKSYTGKSGALAYDNLCWLAKAIDPQRIIVRVPLIQGYNTPEDQENTANALKGMGIINIDKFSYVIR